MTWNRIAGTIGALTVIVLLVAMLTPAVNVASRAITVAPELVPADAIVVLGAGLLLDGTMNYDSMERFVFGVRLYKLGLSPLMIMSGPPRRNTAPESTVRAHLATELGVPPAAILELNDVETTRDEAQETAKLLLARNLKHVLLVTSSLHMLRAKLVFEAAGLRVSAAPVDNFPVIAVEPGDRLYLLKELAMHSFGLLYYRLAGFIS